MTEDRIMLSAPQEIIISEDINDPDQYLDQMIDKLSDKTEQAAAIEAVKSLGHDEKVSYILGLRTGKERTAGDVSIMMEPASGCIIVIIWTIVTVIIGYIVKEGVKEAITEEQEIERECEVCPDKK